MKRLAVVLVVLAALGPATLWAVAAEPADGRNDPPPRGDRPGGERRGDRDRDSLSGRNVPFDQDFFAPDVVLRNQVALELTAAQLDALKKLINGTHAELLDIQADLERETELFKQAIAPSKVSENDAIARADRMLALEVRMKRAQLTLLVRVKNLLTDKQQATLRSQRPPRREPAERGNER